MTSKYVDAFDTLTERLTQAVSMLAFMQVAYSMEPKDEHPLSPTCVNEALWTVETLVKQAEDAANVLLDASFVPAKRRG